MLKMRITVVIILCYSQLYESQFFIKQRVNCALMTFNLSCLKWSACISLECDCWLPAQGSSGQTWSTGPSPAPSWVCRGARGTCSWPCWPTSYETGDTWRWRWRRPVSLPSSPGGEVHVRRIFHYKEEWFTDYIQSRCCLVMSQLNVSNHHIGWFVHLCGSIESQSPVDKRGLALSNIIYCQIHYRMDKKLP